MREVRFLASTLLLVLLLAACVPKTVPVPPPAPQAPSPLAAPAPVTAPGPKAAPAAPAKPTWQIEWEKTVETAKKEGKLVVYTSTGAKVRAELQKVFSDRFGISGGLDYRSTPVKAED